MNSSAALVQRGGSPAIVAIRSTHAFQVQRPAVATAFRECVAMPQLASL